MNLVDGKQNFLKGMAIYFIRKYYHNSHPGEHLLAQMNFQKTYVRFSVLRYLILEGSH